MRVFSPSRLLLFLGAAFCLLPVAAAGQASESQRGLQAFPAGRIYPAYLADPRLPEFGLTLLQVEQSGVPDAGSPRYGLKLGGRFGLLRWGGGEGTAGPWQIDIEAGFAGQFDIDHSLDNLGWDGHYAFLLSRQAGERLVLQVGAKHVSGHVGDEYAERTGRRRLDATREELALGAAWTPGVWQAYAEAGWDPEPNEDIAQEPWRLQTGLQRQGLFAGGQRLGWFGAANLEALEDRDWEVDVSLQAGLIVPAAERRWRVGLQWYDGRVPLTELAPAEESYLVLGLWLVP
ncbi:MAG TPA: DUF1207 domain-containing protein [Thermoanaerobaculia bacterium]|nr:DUF1207 domain-containing protein [Thermoanaerobaculia bacterium]